MKLFPLSTSQAMCLWKQGRSVVAICLLALFPGAATAQTQTFMDEIRAIRAKSKTADVEIHNLAAKYVPVGTRKEAAFGLFVKQISSKSILSLKKTLTQKNTMKRYIAI